MLSIHEGNKAFECETCDKSFSKKANMKEHISTINPWGNKIVQNSKMKKHMLSVHEGNKAFECETCDKSYLWVKVNPPFYPIWPS